MEIVKYFILFILATLQGQQNAMIGTIISKCYATTTATTKINGNVSSSSMDGSTIKNENRRAYA